MSTDTAEGRAAAGTRPRGLRAVLLFLRQVAAELRKVVRPTRTELIRHTVTVLVFVTVMIALVIGLDFVLGTVSTPLFTGTAEQ